MEELSKTKISLISRLGNAKQRRKLGKFLVEGTKSVIDMLDFPGLEMIGATESWVGNNMDLLKSVGIPESRVYHISRKEMRALSTLSTPPEVIALFNLPSEDSEKIILTTPLPKDLYLLLDGIQDPGNLGTIIRTCHWFGIKKIFASHQTADIYNSKTIQASMGSLKGVEVVYADLSALVKANPDIPLCGLMLDGQNIYSATLPTSAFIVMGNEGNGVSESLARLIKMRLTIPPYYSDSHGESLNVGIATAVALAQFRRPELIKK